MHKEEEQKERKVQRKHTGHLGGGRGLPGGGPSHVCWRGPCCHQTFNPTNKGRFCYRPLSSSNLPCAAVGEGSNMTALSSGVVFCQFTSKSGNF